MALFTNTAEGGTSGVGVTTANSGGASGDAWTAVQLGNGTSVIVFSDEQTAHGGLSYKHTPATSQNCNLQWDQPADVAVAIRFYLYLVAASAASQQFAFFLTSASGTVAQLRFSSSQQIQVADSAQSVVHTFTNALSLATWYRVEAKLHRTNQTVDVAFYALDDATPIEEANLTAVNMGGTDCGRVRFGRGSTGSNSVFYQDDVAYEPGRTDYLGPAAGGAVAETGHVAAGATVVATHVKVVRASGLVALGLGGEGVASHAQTGIVAAGTSPHAAAEKLVSLSGSARTGLAADAGAAKRASATGLLATGDTVRHSGTSTRAQAGLVTLGSGATSRHVRSATATGTVGVGVDVAASVRRSVATSGLVTLATWLRGLTSSEVTPLRCRVSGREPSTSAAGREPPTSISGEECGR